MSTNNVIGNNDKNTQILFEVRPVQVDITRKYEGDHTMSANSADFILIVIVVEVISIIAALIWGGTFWIWGLVVIAIFFGIRKLNNDSKDEEETESVIKAQKKQATLQARIYSENLNLILSKSKQIVEDILPYYENAARQSIEIAKIEFSENAYSPFWSEIERASKFLAYYKEAVDQLCTNSELYKFTLKDKSHNFPVPFPLATNISISQDLINEYNSIIRKAQTKATFSIIWEQRRNSAILIAGFSSLENTIRNMSIELQSSINELNYSIRSELNAITRINKEQLMTFEKSQAFLNHTLTSMDNKLYYIEWNRKPPGKFFYR